MVPSLFCFQKGRIMKLKQFALTFLILLCIPLRVFAEETVSSVSIPVISDIENGNETFTCVLSDENGEIDRITVDSGKESGFTVFVTEPGVRSFTVHQISGTDRNVTYDNTVYRVDLHTVIENSVMKSEPVIYVEGTADKFEKCRFSNIKPIPEVKESEVLIEKKSVLQNITEIIKTGDMSSLGLWLFLTLISIMGICIHVLLFFKRKKGDRA